MALSPKKTIVFLLWGGFSTLFVGALWHQNTVYSTLLALSILSVLSVWFLHEWHQEAGLERWYEGLYFSLGAVLTLALHHGTPLNAIAAASLVGVGAALALKPGATAIVAGAYLGMSAAFFMAPWALVLTVLGGGFLYAFTAPFFNGLGGKLGFVAWMTALFSALFLRYPLIGESSEISWLGLWLLSLAFLILTAALVQKASVNNVLASSAIGLGLAVWVALFPQMTVYGAAAYGVTFVGMSRAERLPFNGMVLIAGTVYTVIFYFMMPYFPGLGGKLGAMAFVSTVITTTLQRLINKS